MIYECFLLGGQGSERNVIYKYLLGSLILTFPICSEDNITGVYFLGDTLKGLAGLPMMQSRVIISANICYKFVQTATVKTHTYTNNNSSSFDTTFPGIIIFVIQK